uniref:C2H2-type domain-containing protein n=1 Tax=Mucochytrium quahogii TaxID=96639 RepID=A0A7S2S353_9STRA|mmetsp:Transcript_2788/g.3997  ORF Transcript_2788/g.3997 Transcript_2788/m.3997 type:complete len:434 (-) Transcript_2788:2392-3693(-)
MVSRDYRRAVTTCEMANLASTPTAWGDPGERYLPSSRPDTRTQQQQMQLLGRASEGPQKFRRQTSSKKGGSFRSDRASSTSSTTSTSSNASGGPGFVPKYSCRACGENFPNWSQCLSHVRSMEVTKDPELHALTASPEGRRELQKICKYTPPPEETPQDAQVSTHDQIPEEKTETPLPGRAAERQYHIVAPPPGTQMDIVHPASTPRKKPSMTISPSSRHSSPSNFSKFGGFGELTSLRPTKQFGRLNPANYNFSECEDRASVSSFSSVSISPSSTPQHSPLGSPRRALSRNPTPRSSMNEILIADPKQTVQKILSIGSLHHKQTRTFPTVDIVSPKFLGGISGNDSSSTNVATNSMYQTQHASHEEKTWSQSREPSSCTGFRTKSTVRNNSNQKSIVLTQVPSNAAIILAEFLSIEDLYCLTQALKTDYAKR